MRSTKTRRIALLGMLFALAMVLSFLESMLSGVLGLPPGIKPGLANIVVMYALLFLGAGDALVLVVLKALFGLLTRGVTAGLLSLCGGICSLLIMLVLVYGLRQKSAYFIVSAAGAIAHNMGQLVGLALFTQSVYTWYYAPVLLVAGLVMGGVTALSLRAVLPALEHLGLHQNK